VEGELVIVGHPKRHAALRVAACSDKVKGERKKEKASADVPLPVLNETNPSVKLC
jgi:hypothetical protein